jgi:hypothetical protein
MNMKKGFIRTCQFYEPPGSLYLRGAGKYLIHVSRLVKAGGGSTRVFGKGTEEMVKRRFICKAGWIGSIYGKG